ncbi:endopeptidase La, partial [Oxalobacteraceae bacterium OM1]
MVTPISIGRARSIAAAQEATRHELPIGILLQRDAAVDSPAPDQLHPVGTVANIVRYVTGPENAHHIVCQGVQRFHVIEHLSGYPFNAARVRLLEEEDENRPAIQALLMQLR